MSKREIAAAAAKKYVLSLDNATANPPADRFHSVITSIRKDTKNSNYIVRTRTQNKLAVQMARHVREVQPDADRQDGRVPDRLSPSD